MVKKILIISVLFVGTLSKVWSGEFYVGPALSYANLSPTNNNGNRFKGITPMLMGGYGDWLGDWIFMALELFGGRWPIDIKNEPNGFTLKTRYTFGASLIPAIDLDQYIGAYARLGVIYSKFESINANRRGYEGGLGLSASKDCWTLRGEYDYAKYKPMAVVGRVKAHQLTLSAIYTFV